MGETKGGTFTVCASEMGSILFGPIPGLGAAMVFQTSWRSALRGRLRNGKGEITRYHVEIGINSAGSIHISHFDPIVLARTVCLAVKDLERGAPTPQIIAELNKM